MLRVLKIVPLIFFLSGCAFTQAKPAVVSSVQGRIESDKIIDKEALQKGGKLLVVPLRPGAGVAADEETNRISLMFVKGMTEAVETNSSSLKAVPSGEAAGADFIVKGYITKASEIKGIKRWFPGSKKIQLGVEGKIVDAKTDLTVYYFSRNQTAQGEGKDFKIMAYDLGKEIGQFVSHLQ